MFEQKNNGQDEQKSASSYISSPEVGTDELLEPYRPYIDNFDLTNEQKLELISAISLMADIILDARFNLIKQPHTPHKRLANNSASSNGVGHGN